MKGRAIIYSAEELAWIEENKDWPRAMLHKFFCMFFERDDVALGALNALCKRKGWMTGRNGCFTKGQSPHNKGKPCPDGKGGRHPNARRTQFRKGNLPHNTRELWSERVDSNDGYVYISVPETNPHTGFERRYVLKHKWEWEKANGPVPKGHALKCLDGNRQNCDPSNWAAVPRALLPRLAGGNRYRRILAYDDAAPEVRPTLIAVAQLEHASRKRAKREAPRREAGVARQGEHAVGAADAPKGCSA